MIWIGRFGAAARATCRAVAACSFELVRCLGSQVSSQFDSIHFGSARLGQEFMNQNRIDFRPLGDRNKQTPIGQSEREKMAAERAARRERSPKLSLSRSREFLVPSLLFPSRLVLSCPVLSVALTGVAGFNTDDDNRLARRRAGRPIHRPTASRSPGRPEVELRHWPTLTGEPFGAISGAFASRRAFRPSAN